MLHCTALAWEASVPLRSVSTLGHAATSSSSRTHRVESSAGTSV
jgi:hypothetical protein